MKVGYVVEEKVEYRTEIILETELTEDELMEEMERAERNAETAKEVAYLLEQVPGIKIIEYPSSQYDSPDFLEVEYWDHRLLD